MFLPRFTEGIASRCFVYLAGMTSKDSDAITHVQSLDSQTFHEANANWNGEPVY
jgi:hypothetical protein